MPSRPTRIGARCQSRREKRARPVLEKRSNAPLDLAVELSLHVEHHRITWVGTTTARVIALRNYKMRILQRSERTRPLVSLVLLDWSVRESFHLLHYLARQTVPREQFEVIVVEYYDREAAALAAFRHMVDTWVLLEMPPECYYHKHLMYNVGIALARGEVVLFCDSDAMVRASFVESIVTAFAAQPRIVLHLDQFRNVRQDLYPFTYPSFETVLGPGCINNAGGRPRGLAETVDPLHNRNYGACMAARRDDLIAIGGADEHLDYLGHICGPYEMTFRLTNHGLLEVWHPAEFLYHTWHPGQAGDGNYLGPHDGRHMSTTALEARTSGRTRPLVENPAIGMMRSAQTLDAAALEQWLIAADRPVAWAGDRGSRGVARWMHESVPWLLDHYNGYNVVGFAKDVFAVPCSAGAVDLQVDAQRERPDVLRCHSLETARAAIDDALTKQGRREAPLLLSNVPVLVHEGYKGFNIVRAEARFYGIPQGEGEFNLESVRRRLYSTSYVSDTEPQVRRLIDRGRRFSAWRSVLQRANRIVKRLS
jgi:hypothetical protein